MSAHRTTDPACTEFKMPTGPWAQRRYDRARGQLCVECALDRQRKIMRDNLRAIITEQVIGQVMAVLRDEIDKTSWDPTAPIARLAGLQQAYRRVGLMQHPETTGGTITPQTLQEP